ncbi:uncharacterized protein PFL1_04152 [Pseudozyma flocculosa PF-1]|uniref:Related to RMT2 - protein-arginine N-methyltransferase n=2 Tax=Pseudozyma flocculosa TaxID=84751 RepID=A0A5C3EUS7_9BASI|nr:uncharacterized protein PFL1_04152 [Pseudozyma flocculosa PF-1]EPQ28325.1 hypothetical protein PFL1_04152 [Pseudozyma flocculosa PF-1]SPO35475.1 related to RMT2 - protein-arginine N-methyltransferase [Pseudozyma flocculosa]
MDAAEVPSPAAAAATAVSPNTAGLALPAERVALNLQLHVAAARGDLEACKALLDHQPYGADAWYEDADAHGWSALHYAAEAGHAAVIRLLLRRGAIWNAVDHFGITAAEVAHSMNWEKCYRALFDEGVRRTLLENVLARQQGQQSVDGAQDDVEDAPEGTAVATAATTTMTAAAADSGNSGGEGDGNRHDPAAYQATPGQITLHAPTHNEVSTSNDAFLSSRLRFFADEKGKMRCLDQDGGMVMADWESDIMKLSARLICSPHQPGFSALNVGFGLGIVDTFIQEYRPGRHVIIEPHPDAIAYMRSKGWDKVPGVEIFEGKWEDWIRDDDNDESVKKREQLGSFDAVYWDTYSQDYSELQRFFECLPYILNGPDSRFSFFHGLAATNPFFYDVYTRLAELDLIDVGLDTQWHVMTPECPEEEWDGVLRKYWSLESYACPVARYKQVEPTSVD